MQPSVPNYKHKQNNIKKRNFKCNYNNKLKKVFATNKH